MYQLYQVLDTIPGILDSTADYHSGLISLFICALIDEFIHFERMNIFLLIIQVNS